MKNLIVTIFCASTLMACAGGSNIQEEPNDHTEYSVLWGLAETENYERTSKALNKHRDSLRALRKSHALDTTNQEIKSYLWGAIKWSKSK